MVAHTTHYHITTLKLARCMPGQLKCNMGVARTVILYDVMQSCSTAFLCREGCFAHSMHPEKCSYSTEKAVSDLRTYKPLCTTTCLQWVSDHAWKYQSLQTCPPPPSHNTDLKFLMFVTILESIIAHSFQRNFALVCLYLLPLNTIKCIQ